MCDVTAAESYLIYLSVRPRLFLAYDPSLPQPTTHVAHPANRLTDPKLWLSRGEGWADDETSTSCQEVAVVVVVVVVAFVSCAENSRSQNKCRQRRHGGGAGWNTDGSAKREHLFGMCAFGVRNVWLGRRGQKGKSRQTPTGHARLGRGASRASSSCSPSPLPNSSRKFLLKCLQALGAKHSLFLVPFARASFDTSCTTSFPAIADPRGSGNKQEAKIVGPSLLGCHCAPIGGRARCN